MELDDLIARAVERARAVSACRRPNMVNAKAQASTLVVALQLRVELHFARIRKHF